MPRRAPSADAAPVGVVLAGGAGRRIGGDKAVVALAGRPLVLYPVLALGEVVHDVAVVAKRTTALPPLTGLADVWIEPDEPRHPLTGIVHALHVAAGRPVLAVAGDLPFADPPLLRSIIDAAADGAVAVVPRAAGRLQPLCALYTARALPLLSRFGPQERASEVVARLGLRILEAHDDQPFHNVNRPEDLLHAAALLDR